MNSELRISFLVPTLGSRTHEIKRLLDSLGKQTYQNFDVVFVVQENFGIIEGICSDYEEVLDIKIVNIKDKGLSIARNHGLNNCDGDIVVLSDDDCWYPDDAAENITKTFVEKRCEIALTQIYDMDNKRNYKKYNEKGHSIESVFSLLSKSSIEIAFVNRFPDERFDEHFGLGAHFVCGEEVDFLIRLFRAKIKIYYSPIVTVYHERKYAGSNEKQVLAKGALYAKNFNMIIGFLICVKDLLLRREQNFKPFFEGFNEYNKKFKRASKTN